MQVLTEYEYNYYSDRGRFCEENRELISDLIGKTIIGIYQAWDNASEEWDFDAPVIIEFENGDLTVNTSCGTKIGLVWNGLFHNEKPAWYREKPQEFDWEENLEWKAPEFSNAFKGKTLIEVDLIGNESTITGIVLSLSDGQKVGVVDYGDVTKILLGEEMSEYLREEKRNGCILSNIVEEDTDARKQKRL